MQFEFEKNLPHKKYPTTFLKNVAVSFSFPAVDPLKAQQENLYEAFCSYIKGSFGIDCIDGKFWEEEKTLINNDKSVIFGFDKENANVMMWCPKYVSFIDSVIPQVFKLRLFAKEVLKIESVNSITIMKTNCWNGKFTHPEEKSFDVVAKYILSKPYLEQIDENQSEIKEKNWHDKERRLGLFSKLECKLNDESEFTLDLRALAMQYGECRLSDLDDVLLGLNNLLYDFYHWCVSDNVIKMMEEQ